MYVASCTVELPITGKALATGYPLANTHIFILDEGFNPLPIGEPFAALLLELACTNGQRIC